jgi:molecular chaperone HtpG
MRYKNTVAESYSFQAETTQLLDLMIHSLYTQRDIFLRELISNASDALDRLRFETLLDPTLVEGNHPYEIRLLADPAGQTLTVADTGIGMSRDEVIANIGTIARSGTRELRKRMQETADGNVADLIGQFGVGFYSAFMVADQVTILTRRANEQTATRWESAGDGTFTVTGAEKASCGTEIVLHLRAPDASAGIEDYSDRYTLAAIVRKYSDFIAYPITYVGPAPPSSEPAPASGQAFAEASGQTSGQASDQATETAVLNSRTPIWTRRRTDVPESEYKEFYRQVSHDWHDPLKVLPLKAEGVHNYEALLFIPSQAPPDLFYHASTSRLRLYAKRVMVMDTCEDLLPRYLRFVKGVVDSSDLPLNISRQRLQQDRHITHIRKWLTRKVLDALAAMQKDEPDTYVTCWRQFGRVLKEGVGTETEYKDRLLPLLLFESSSHPQDLTTLQAYVERMKPEQREILYLTGESRRVIEHSPHLEALIGQGYEVLFLSDPVDELLAGDLHEFEGKRLKSAAKGRIQLGTGEEQQAADQLAEREREWKPFLDAGQQRLDPYVKQMRLTTRLVGSPACLVTEEHEYSPQLERLLQKGKGGGAKQRRIMELNAAHPVVAALHRRFAADAQDPAVGDSIELLFELALMAEGSDVADVVRLQRLMLDLLQKVV